MPRRPPTSGYARIAQAEEEEEEDPYRDDDAEDVRHDDPTPATPGSHYAPIHTKRRERLPGFGGGSSPKSPKSPRYRRRRTNSGVDIKAINARFERWAEEIAHKFNIRKVKGKSTEEEQLEIHYSVFQAPEWIRPATREMLTASNEYDTSDRLSKLEFDDLVESVRTAIELGMHPKLITQGSSGSYFARNSSGKVVGVFKPKDEEPYASKNPKWTKWIHRNLFPFAFGRACLIPNLSYVSEAAAYVLDCRLRTNLVPYTEVVSLSSKSFFYDFWERRAHYRKKRPFPEKLGSFQVFLKGFKDATMFLREHPWPDQTSSILRTDGIRKPKRRRWAEDCRPDANILDDEDTDDETSTRPGTGRPRSREAPFWTPELQQSLREQLERLVVLDYIMRNTDRGLDNWMIRIDKETNTADIVVEPPKDLTASAGYQQDGSNGSTQPYSRRETMTTATSNPFEDQPEPQGGPRVTIGAIDNSLSWPWKHPDAWRSFPFGWLFLPVSLIGNPFSSRTRSHFLPLLTSSEWWMETKVQLRRCFELDSDFSEKMFARQMAVMKGQAWNVVETLKTADHGPLELCRRTRVCVWDDIVEIPVATPMRPSQDLMHREHQSKQKKGISEEADDEQEEMDISAALGSTNTNSKTNGLIMGPTQLASSAPSRNRFNISRQNSSNDITRNSEDSAPLSPSSINEFTFDAGKELRLGSRPSMPTRSRTRLSMEEPRRLFDNLGSQRRRRFSLGLSRRNTLTGRLSEDDGDGDLGFAAAEDQEANLRKVIVERLETVKSKNPVFTWC